MNLHKAVGVRGIDSGDLSIHADADPGANYHTLCGLSLDDDLFEETPISTRSRITCKECFQVWNEARRFKREDFYIKG